MQPRPGTGETFLVVFIAVLPHPSLYFLRTFPFVSLISRTMLLGCSCSLMVSYVDRQSVDCINMGRSANCDAGPDFFVS